MTEVTETDRVWLRNEETGGHFHCPIAAVPAWKARGWVDSEAPPEVNLALDGRVPIEAPAPAADEKPTTTDDQAEPKNRRRTPASDTEGVNS